MAISDFFKKVKEQTKPGQEALKTVGEFTRDVGQVSLRGFAAAGQDIFERFSKVPDIKKPSSFISGVVRPTKDAEFVPTGQFQKEVLGTEEPVSFETLAQEVGIAPTKEAFIKAEEERRGMTFTAEEREEVGKRFNPTLALAAPFAGRAIALADVIPGGKTTKQVAINAIKTIKNADEAKDFLTKSVGLTKNMADELAEEAVKLTDEKQIGAFIDRAVGQAQKEVAPLVEEARKFKTAEEFVDSILFHGTIESRAKDILGGQGLIASRGRVDYSKGRGIRYVSATPDADAALGFASGRGEQAVIVGIPKPKKILELGDIRVDGKLTKEGQDFVKKFGRQELDWGGKDVEKFLKENDYEAVQFLSSDGNVEVRIFGDVENPIELPKGFVKTTETTFMGKPSKQFSIDKSQLTDIFNQAQKQTTPVPLAKRPLGEQPVRDAVETPKPKVHKVLTTEGRKLVDSEGRVVFPRDSKRAPTPLSKPSAIDEAREMIKADREAKKALEGLSKKRGSVDEIVKNLEKRGVTPEEIDKIVLEDGTMLKDAVKVKREANGVLSTVITKDELEDIRKNFTLDIESERWIPTKTAAQKAKEFARTGKEAALDFYELPQVFFDRTGLRKHFYDPIREAERNAQNLKTNIFQQFDEAGLLKRGSWFTADRFDIPKADAEDIGRYYLTRQGKEVDRAVSFGDLSEKSQEFIRIFDGVIADTKPRFYQVAELNGKEPGEVANYAPLMTSADMKLAQEVGDMDFIFRKHPAFFSLKKRQEKVPFNVYELDYRNVASQWINQMANFLHLGEVGVKTKYLAQSDEFKEIVGDKTFATTNKWIQDIFNPQIPSSIEKGAQFGRRSAAIASLGLNLASVVKQALTQVPLSIIEKAPPKLKSKFAEAFEIDVANLPSIKERKGNIAIADMQEGIAKAFVGPLSEFDKTNAQLSLNALLDKNMAKFVKEGKELTPEVQAQILKMSQDRLDMWFGGMTRAQLPRAFRSEVGKLVNMFIQPLTSQLNGFFYSVAKEKGYAKAGKLAEVMASAVSIAYLEQVVTNWSLQWSDEKAMAEDVLSSLAGNIPIVSQIVFAMRSDQPIQVSPAISNAWRAAEQVARATKGQATAVDVGFAFAEMFGLPKQIRRSTQGIQVILDGGVLDKEGKMLAPVRGTDEKIRAFIRGKYGTIATQDWLRNIGVKSENRKWFVPEVEFLQNGDYERKAEIYNSFDAKTRRELYKELSEGQQKRLDSELEKQGGIRSELKGILNLDKPAIPEEGRSLKQILGK